MKLKSRETSKLVEVIWPVMIGVFRIGINRGVSTFWLAVGAKISSVCTQSEVVCLEQLANIS